ncbi:type II secretion system F family protein [Corynebacterium sp.]|uniref:type II secretion system F family protein n=1 Tax=Corynebacterium sp. TaxID=1720 RepID=UPI0026DD95D4|nr:type II secretion protein F [Corynebacterium sp.]MDO5031872.1 type II secretion protein F [Corynebacterium sp.]
MTYLLCALALSIHPPAVVRRLQPEPPKRRLLPVAVAATGIACVLLGRVSIALAAASVVGCALWYAGDVAAARRERRGREALAAYLGAVAAELRAGATTAAALQHGVEALPDSAPESLVTSLRTAAGLAAHGGRPEKALTSAELRRLGSLVALSAEHGVALAGLVEQAQNQLDAAKRHAQATEASLQGPQATALILAGLPAAGVLMGGAMGADSLGFLLGGGLGGVLLVIGVGLACAGFAWSRWILRRAAA